MGSELHRPFLNGHQTQIFKYWYGLAIRNTQGFVIRNTQGLVLLSPHTKTPHTPASPRNTQVPDKIGHSVIKRLEPLPLILISALPLTLTRIFFVPRLHGQQDLDDPVVQFYPGFFHAWTTKWCGACMKKAKVIIGQLHRQARSCSQT